MVKDGYVSEQYLSKLNSLLKVESVGNDLLTSKAPIDF